MDGFEDPLYESRFKYRDGEITSKEEELAQLLNTKVTPFEEFQHFEKSWIWVVLGIEVLVIMIPLLLTGQPWWFFLMMGTMLVLTMSMLSAMKLYSRIDDAGIHYRMSPFHFGKERSIPWNEIDTVELRSFSGIQVRGYGVRIARNKTIYNVGGKHVIHITKKNGKQIVLGTQKPQEVSRQLDDRPITV